MRKEDPEEKKETGHETWAAAHEKSTRMEDDVLRRLGTLIGFPEVCSHARCRRARQCTGNVDTCFRTFWPHVPEFIKNTMRRAITLVGGGMPAAEALREAEAYAEERERKDAERRGGAPSDAQPDAAPVPRPQPPGASGPRIRTL